MAANTTVGPQQSMLKFEYDWQGRRIRKQVWTNPDTGTVALGND